MSTMSEEGSVPVFDLADRMRKALRHADLSIAQMSDYLGCSRNSVSAWINGRTNPSVQTQRLWAMRTGVPYGWLCGGDGGVRHQGLEPRTRWLSGTVVAA